MCFVVGRRSHSCQMQPSLQANGLAAGRLYTQQSHTYASTTTATLCTDLSQCEQECMPLQTKEAATPARNLPPAVGCCRPPSPAAEWLDRQAAHPVVMLWGVDFVDWAVYRAEVGGRHSLEMVKESCWAFAPALVCVCT